MPGLAPQADEPIRSVIPAEEPHDEWRNLQFPPRLPPSRARFVSMHDRVSLLQDLMLDRVTEHDKKGNCRFPHSLRSVRMTTLLMLGFGVR
jgi:hypothetical protein